MQENRTAELDGPMMDPDHLLPEHAGQGMPPSLLASDPHAVRTEIEQTRARMSRTIDELEEALIRKKERLEQRLDVAAPVRERVRSAPLLYAGGVFAAALAAGWLSAEDEAGPAPAASPPEGDAGELPRRSKLKRGRWEKRARRLAETCERQEEEILALRARLGAGADAGLDAELEASHGLPEPLYDRDEHDLEFQARRSGRSPALLGLVGAGLTAMVAAGVRRLLAGDGGEGGFELEPDLEREREVSREAPPYAAVEKELGVEVVADGLGR
ncbi:MAG TPA: DUF3618 domain-containing protein [Longimicrobiaceae bacterium]|nr:DUF3618 domain-containing protein [Longimicrobiaceae bacterium]